MKHASTTVYWDTLQYRAWTFHLAATDQGLCQITLPDESYDAMRQWVEKHVPGAILLHETNIMEPYRNQLAEYLSGRRKVFTLPLDFRGTPFQVMVWRALLEIPFGTTRSYSQIALAVGRPKSVRAVGAANGANPLPIVAACHRVIGKDGTLTGYGGGLAMKAELLRLEGLGW